MSEWDIALKEWNKFIQRVDSTRKSLFCSISSAWFRGHSNSNWDLAPTLFRNSLKSPSDTQKSINSIQNRIIKIKKAYREKSRKLSDLSHLMNKNGNSNENHKSKGEYKQAKDSLKTIKSNLDSLKQELSVLKAIRWGEKNAFVDFSFRSEEIHQSSWEILAKMQHYKVPTRLLDWTEVLAFAVFFALEEYFNYLEKLWFFHDENLQKKDEIFPFELPPKINSTPCIWILNPYYLSRKATKRNEILDPTLYKRLDYFDCFFNYYSWRYKHPIPIYPPWRNPRIVAQRGVFTVQGFDNRPLNHQVSIKDNILAKVEISPHAAVYGVRHLKTFFEIDTFNQFRDLDNLGKKVSKSFLINR